jgi:O-antigen ligase
MAGWLVFESPQFQKSAIYARIQGRNMVTGGPGAGDWNGNRFLLWKGAARTFANNPITGTGYPNHSILEQFGANVAHNLELDVLYQLGLIGFVPFLCLCGYLIWIKHKLLRRFAPLASDPVLRTFSGLQLLVFVNMQIESPEEGAQYFMYLCVLLTLFVRYVKWLESSQRRRNQAGSSSGSAVRVRSRESRRSKDLGLLGDVALDRQH